MRVLGHSVVVVLRSPIHANEPSEYNGMLYRTSNRVLNNGIKVIILICMDGTSQYHHHRIFAANQDTSVLLCDKRDVYISSTATMNSRTAIVIRENALKLSVNEIVLIQRYWDMI